MLIVNIYQYSWYKSIYEVLKIQFLSIIDYILSIKQPKHFLFVSAFKVQYASTQIAH